MVTMNDDIQSLKFKGESERFGLNLGLLHLSFSVRDLIIVRNQSNIDLGINLGSLFLWLGVSFLILTLREEKGAIKEQFW